MLVNVNFEDQNVPLPPSIRWLPMWRCLLVVPERCTQDGYNPLLPSSYIMDHEVITPYKWPYKWVTWSYFTLLITGFWGPLCKPCSIFQQLLSLDCAKTKGFTTWFSNHRPRSGDSKCWTCCSKRLILE